MAMISNAVAAMDSLEKLNPLTCFWQLLNANNALDKSISEYVKLVEIAIKSMNLDLLKMSGVVFSLTFLEDQLRN